MVEKIWILQNGTIDLDQSVLVAGRGYGNRLTVPVSSALLETDQGYILIDTGLNPLGIKEPESTWGPRAKLLLPTITAEWDIRTQLKRIGISVEDVNTVILTHLHWDHTGGLQYFKHAKIVVQKAEHRFAYEPDQCMAGSYMKNHFDFDLKYETIEGDVEYGEGIDILFTPGHTPGHQSVLITLENGKRCIIPGDAVYSYQNLKEMLPPGNCWDVQQSMLSLNKLKTVARLTGAVIYPSHDPDIDMIERANKEMETS